MSGNAKVRMERDEWLRFKAWSWLVGGTESARVILGVSEEMFETIWMRDDVSARTMQKVREGWACSRLARKVSRVA